MQFTRIVQVTDIHLLEDPDGEILGVKPENSFNEVISHAVTPKVSPDLIIATGDLSDDGSHSAYSRLQTVFEDTNIPVFVLPGNHDSVKQMQTSLVNPNIRMDQHTEIGGWTIIFLNSQIEGEDHGLIGAESLLRLEQVINTTDGKPCLVAVHHSPISGCLSAGCQLENSQEFLDVLEKHTNVKMVISGHTHCAAEQSHSGIELLTTPSSFLHVTHSQEGATFAPEHFMKHHSFDSDRRGYRVIDLFTNGDSNSEVHWVPVTTDASGLRATLL